MGGTGQDGDQVWLADAQGLDRTTTNRFSVSNCVSVLLFADLQACRRLKDRLDAVEEVRTPSENGELIECVTFECESECTAF